MKKIEKIDNFFLVCMEFFDIKQHRNDGFWMIFTGILNFSEFFLKIDLNHPEYVENYADHFFFGLEYFLYS